MDPNAESRRSARVSGRFWVAVEGVDAELTPRVGDISATGIFFEVETDIGDVGTIQWLHVASGDRQRSIKIMAHVVRELKLADVHREIRGVALEFMPESDAAASKLCDFVRYMLVNPFAIESPPHVAARLEARAAVPEREIAPARVSNLSVQTLLLETDWSVPVGEAVRVEIIARGVRRPIRVQGQAVSVLPAGEPNNKRFRIAVEVNSELEGPLRRFSQELQAVDPRVLAPTPKKEDNPLEQLLGSLITPKSEPPEREHLTGLLSRIPFPALCSLLELERLSGILTIRRNADTLRLYVQNGRFVDAEPTHSGKPRETVAALLECRDGSFDFNVTSVDRADKIGASMTQLLLDLARESDEQRA